MLHVSRFAGNSVYFLTSWQRCQDKVLAFLQGHVVLAEDSYISIVVIQACSKDLKLFQSGPKGPNEAPSEIPSRYSSHQWTQPQMDRQKFLAARRCCLKWQSCYWAQLSAQSSGCTCVAILQLLRRMKSKKLNFKKMRNCCQQKKCTSPLKKQCTQGTYHKNYNQT